ncbi:MAG: carbonic anhydrase family protein [Myxococcota bacterium]
MVKGRTDQQQQHSRTASQQWSYEGATAADNWGKLCTEFAQCSLGRQQSPIDIDATVLPTASQQIAIDLCYQPAPLCMRNDGRMLIAACNDNAGFMTANKQRYRLVQFHFHLPSEHCVRAQSYAMEIHLVHENSAKQLAVVAVLVRQGPAHVAIAQLFKQLPNRTAHEGPTLLFDVGSLLPQQRGYFAYQGSLTTPPCTQGVQWYVMMQPITADQQQLDSLLQAMGGRINSRPLQPLNGRTVWRCLP